jgi:hypothetical protein
LIDLDSPKSSDFEVYKMTQNQNTKSFMPFRRSNLFDKIKKTTFKQDLKIDEYYEDEQDNYQDDVPFDLYNMVSVVKRTNKHSTFPNIKLYQPNKFKLHKRRSIA